MTAQFPPPQGGGLSSRPEMERMNRPLVALIVYIAAVFIGAALLAPPLYWLVQHFADAFPHLAKTSLDRYVRRAMLVLAVLGLWPFLRMAGFRSFKELGIVSPRGEWQKFTLGFALSCALILGLTVVNLAVGVRTWAPNFTITKLAIQLASAFAVAFSVATIEEFLFRGGFYGTLRRVMPVTAAIVISSAIFAMLHFLERVPHSGPVEWHSGLALLPQMLGGALEFHTMFPHVLNLFLVGVMFAVAYQRTGNLYFSIGLHAGAIVIIKLQMAFVTPILGIDETIWGTRLIVDGWVATVALLGALALICWIPIPGGRPGTLIEPDRPRQPLVG